MEWALLPFGLQVRVREREPERRDWRVENSWIISAAVVSFSQESAPPGLEATAQGIANALFTGLGLYLLLLLLLLLFEF